MRVISIVLGLFLVVGGVASMLNPGPAALGLGYMMGLFVLIHGVGSLVSQYRFRSLGDGWGVAVAVLSVLLGALMMASGTLRWLPSLAIALIAGLWMLTAGIACMVMAVKLARARRTFPWARRPGLGWLWLLLLGLALSALGILAYVHPVLGALTVGALMGVYVIFAGVHLIALGCCPSTR